MGFEEDRPANLRWRGLMPRGAMRPDLSIVPASGPRFGKAGVIDPPESPVLVSPSLCSWLLAEVLFLCSSAPGDRQEVGGESPPR